MPEDANAQLSDKDRQVGSVTADQGPEGEAVDDASDEFRARGLEPGLSGDPDASARLNSVKDLERERADLEARLAGVNAKLGEEKDALYAVDDEKSPGRNFRKVREGVRADGGSSYEVEKAVQAGDWIRMPWLNFRTWVASGENIEAQRALPIDGIAKVRILEIKNRERSSSRSLVLEADGIRREVDSSLFTGESTRPEKRI